MSISELYALKLQLEKLQQEYSDSFLTSNQNTENYFLEKLSEIRQHLWQIKHELKKMQKCEADRSHLSKCWTLDSSLSHPHNSEIS